MCPRSNNPFYNRPLDDCDPALWSSNDIKALVIPGPHSYRSTRGRVPVFPYPLSPTRMMQRLQTMNYHTHEREIFFDIFELIDFAMITVGADRQISVVNYGSRKLVVNGERFSIPLILGCAVNELPVFHLTCSRIRYEECRQLLPDLEHVPQDEVSTHGFDVAALIAQAREQKEWSEGPDGVYKTHVMYPTADYKKLVLLTGFVPYATVIALQEGHEMLEPIVLSREIIDVPINPDCDWKEIELFQIIAGLVDEGAQREAVFPDDSDESESM